MALACRETQPEPHELKKEKKPRDRMDIDRWLLPSRGIDPRTFRLRSERSTTEL